MALIDLRRGDLDTGTWRLHEDGDLVATLLFEHAPGLSTDWAVRLADGTRLPADAPTPTGIHGNWPRLRQLSAATAAWLQRPGVPAPDTTPAS